MNCILPLHLHVQRRASCAAVTAATNIYCLPQQKNRHRFISSTPFIASTPAGPSSSEKAQTKQNKANKEKKGPSSKKKASEDAKKNHMTELAIKALDTPHKSPPKASAEEMERRYHVGRNYVIGCFKRHNEQNHDLAAKIRMKQAAMRMLPKEGEAGDKMVNGASVFGRWRKEAFKLNESWGPPEHRLIPMHTPPIEGFDPNLYIGLEEEDD